MFYFYKTFNNLHKSFTKLYCFNFFTFKSCWNKASFKMSSSKCLISVCQHTCKSNKDENFNAFKDLISQSSKYGCKMVFLPECFDMICEKKQDIFENAETIDGQLVTKYKKLASDLQVWLFLGGLHEKNQNGKPSNAHIVINHNGEIVSVYRKLHLFNLDIPGTRLVESDFSKGGDCVELPVDTPAGKVGLGICYDLRFPEFAISLAKAGANILTYPSSFTVKTGISHWEPLLKARAIENQCYVVAAAQTGIHNSKRSSFGHSMVVDPWGQIIAQVGDKTGYAIAEIDINYLENVRTRLPIWKDRKPECYGEIFIKRILSLEEIDKCNEYTFGNIKIKSSQVFLKTNHSFAFVNHRPVLPGHVLISSLRKVKNFTDLNSFEVSDLFTTVQRVGKLLKKIYETDSCSIVLQDGLDAGQSVEHVHVHVTPRKPTDFGGNINEIYIKLYFEKKEIGNIRTEQNMAEQVQKLRSILKLENL